MVTDDIQDSLTRKCESTVFANQSRNTNNAEQGKINSQLKRSLKTGNRTDEQIDNAQIKPKSVYMNMPDTIHNVQKLPECVNDQQLLRTLPNTCM